MWEIVFNIGMVVVGMGLLLLVSWATDRKDDTFEGLEYGDDEEL